MGSLELAKKRILEVISGSEVPEDFPHAEDTLNWVLRLDPTADPGLQLAALGHDIDRAVTARKTHREDFADYDAFKAQHARNGAAILREILEVRGAQRSTRECRRQTSLKKLPQLADRVVVRAASKS